MSPTGSSSSGVRSLLIRTVLVPACMAALAIGVLALPTDRESPGAAGQPALLLVATSTGTPSLTPSPTPTFTPTSTATATPLWTPTSQPTPTPSPAPQLRPQPDGVDRSARVPILMYHYISIPPDPADRLRVDLSVVPENFEAQMQWLAENNYHTITLTDLYAYLAIGAPLPDNPIILTFDDGYADQYENAFPILQKYNFAGTFFILAGPADVASPRYLTWDRIAEMSDAGMDMEVHGRDHLDLRRRTDEFLYFQIVGARQAIEAHTGKPARFFAYPAGRYDGNLLRFLDQYDFWMAVTAKPGRIHTLDAPLELTRVRIRGTGTLKSFIAKVTTGQ